MSFGMKKQDLLFVAPRVNIYHCALPADSVAHFSEQRSKQRSEHLPSTCFVVLLFRTTSLTNGRRDTTIRALVTVD